MLSCPLERYPPKEAREGAIQVAQRFLRSTLRHLVHPRHRGRLERVQLAMQVHRRWTLARLAIRFLLPLQAPIVGPARRPRMPLTRGGLLVIQVKLDLVGALDGAHASSTCSACSTQRLTHA